MGNIRAGNILEIGSFGLRAMVLTVLLATSAKPQLACDIGLMADGSWHGPMTLGEMSPHGEIALAAVLPPPMVEELLGTTRVLFGCRTNCATLASTPAVFPTSRTFLWNPRTDDVDELLVDPAPADFSADVFCSGLTFDGEGQLWIVGGLNYADKCAGNFALGCDQLEPMPNPDAYGPVGHKASYRLPTDGVQLDWLAGPEMNVERWYPTAITLGDGNVFVTGHRGQPNATCPAPYPPGAYPYTHAVDQFREVLNVPANLFEPALLNDLGASSGCSDVGELRLDEYPRLHLSMTNSIIWTNSLILDNGVKKSRIFQMELPSASAVCPNLWKAESSAAFRGLITGGSSVQLIYRDDQGDPHEVFYLIGGTFASEDDPCEAIDAITAGVRKVIDPGPGAIWTETPPLTEPRVNHNTVILPSGELLVVGGGGNGVNPCVSGGQEALKVNEIMRPPEIFSSSAGLWTRPPDEEDPPHSLVPHLYHSVAGLLPDGRVFLAGSAEPTHAYYAAELYSPWYYFAPNRPVITAWPKPTEPGADGVIRYGLTSSITVSSSCLVERIVLIRNAAVTHSFDMNQRYIELEFDKVGGSITNPILDVIGPETPRIAPPGFYMMFAIDGVNVPSKGQWVRVGDA